MYGSPGICSRPVRLFDPSIGRDGGPLEPPGDAAVSDPRAGPVPQTGKTLTAGVEKLPFVETPGRAAYDTECGGRPSASPRARKFRHA